MKNYFLILILFYLPVSLSAQVNIYEASTIPESLKKGASSIKRVEEIQFNVQDEGKGNYKVHQVITVLNATATEQLVFQQYSNKFRSLQEAEIKVYNEQGIKINTYKKREMKTFSASDEDVDDIKITMFQVSTASYPVTVEFNYEVSYNGFFRYENYQIQDPEQAVEQSKFTVTVPRLLDLRYKAVNTDLKPQISEVQQNKTYVWSCSNVAARVKEAGAGSIRNYFPSILLAPNKVNYDGYQGDVSTWKNMGLWYNDLTRDLGNIPQSLKDDIQSLTVNATTDLEKAKLIYHHLQNNFRYVSIQLGIGGFKPFSPTYVNQKKYGDCKALSNYMQATLASVGIKSYNAWITSDRYPPAIDPTFAYDHFNHQVLCLMSGKDTTWLECTSKTLDFGEMGSSTENRYALLLTESGGVLVKTPSSKPWKNAFITNSMITLSEDGSGRILTKIVGTGEYRQQLKYISDLDQTKQKDFYVRYMQFPNGDSHNSVYEEAKDKITAELEINAESVPAFSAGSKMFLNPRPAPIWKYKLTKEDNRKQDYFLDCPFDKRDTTLYQLPEGFVVEALPKARDFKFELGRFHSEYVYDKEKRVVTSIASIVIDQQNIPASKFNTACKFFNDVLEEFTDKIVVRKD